MVGFPLLFAHELLDSLAFQIIFINLNISLQQPSHTIIFISMLYP